MNPDFGLADVILILFVTIGPLKAAIMYAKLTTGTDRAFQKTVAFNTVGVATIVTLVFVFFGQNLLDLFHVSLPALKIAGGLILLLFALDMVIGEHKDHVEGGVPSTQIAIYPLAMPLMATPQGLVAITAIVAETQTFVQKLVVAAVVLGIMALNLAILLSAGVLIKGGAEGRQIVISKVMGLLLSALAIQLMISAFRDLGVLAPLAAAH
jgi:multiple antibiotic resistance protein